MPRPLTPPDHPQRHVLANEVHARPLEPLSIPGRVVYLAVLIEPAERSAEHAQLTLLCESYAAAAPPVDAIYYSVNLGALRLRWEKHAEFSSYAFHGDGEVSAEWLAAIPGRTLVSAIAKVHARSQSDPDATHIAALFEHNDVVGADIGAGVAHVFSDFRIHPDGYLRFEVFDHGLSRRQAGRTVQRLFEIETYRMMALLALPVARTMAPQLREMEREVASLAALMAGQASTSEQLLDALTGMAARLERDIAESRFRFGAAQAYYDLVLARIAELRERRLPGTETLGEFMARRLAPAMATCESVTRRQLELSERIARASNLLSTQVGIVREQQNSELLASMNRRGRLQLRLQETIEGLSVIAITYYAVGLVGYGAKALTHANWPLDPDIAMGVSIPVIGLLVALGLHYVRRTIIRVEDNGIPAESKH
ncbi:conserved protein of unknown function [Georgfuchsia toluolica]|uniref:Membrane-anchored protein n=1 Tax=Georgfuchsia toluolica TaxID=424218 RepID=A0A916J583_9PROT|nr:DUF3422 domain-containing protein [Georgfuchsia toluolica]CAG4884191.1 conserved protein of unknown function [Georgfuchsia toluolica]